MQHSAQALGVLRCHEELKYVSTLIFLELSFINIIRVVIGGIFSPLGLSVVAEYHHYES